MAREISQRELRNESGEIMRQLDRGETFVVTPNDVPVGRLSPLRRHRFVRTEAVIEMFQGGPGIDLRAPGRSGRLGRHDSDHPSTWPAPEGHQ